MINDDTMESIAIQHAVTKVRMKELRYEDIGRCGCSMQHGNHSQSHRFECTFPSRLWRPFQNAKIAFLPPCRPPRILDDPKVLPTGGVGAPSYSGDCMIHFLEEGGPIWLIDVLRGSGVVRVYAARIVHEIRIDFEADSDGTIIVDLLHHALL